MKRITYFLSGALAALLISSATVSAFAAGGLITLNVQPAPGHGQRRGFSA